MKGHKLLYTCVLVVMLCSVEVARCDSRCLNRFGTCKYTSEGCLGGSFTRGLCNGPANRRCCVPGGASSGGSCYSEVQNLACELANSPNVVAARAHPSGMRDKAYARNNLVDVCNGKRAARSQYTCRECPYQAAPGGSTCLSLNMLLYLVDLQNNGNVKINEIAGACHSCESRHYSGLAVDLNRYEPRTNRDRTQEYVTKCAQFGGTMVDEGTHIHCQFTDGTHPNW